MQDYQTILLSSSVEDAAFSINENGMGTVFVVDENQVLVGVVTDGDIRRHLISGGLKGDYISRCMNTSFTSEKVTARREVVLKRLDARVKHLPLLDGGGKIVKIVNRKGYPFEGNNLKSVRARAPVRVSFAGGGTDLSGYFLGDGMSLVLNTTIQKYCRASMTLRSDQVVTISSLDIGMEMECHLSEIDKLGSKDFDLFASIVSIVKPEFGFDIQIASDVPIGSGLGGSSAASAAFLGCLNEVRSVRWTPYELAEICYQAERHYADIAGGWQDQYASVFGGLNLMEFSSDKHVVTPLQVSSNIQAELEDSLVLFDTGIRHDSGTIHGLNFGQNSVKKDEALKEAAWLAKAMKDCILVGNLTEFGCLLDRGWQSKKAQNDNISDDFLDKIYTGARKNGAIGGKLLGAGAGGFFLFMADPKNVPALISYLDGKGGKAERVLLDKEGLKHWVVKSDE